MRRALIVTFTIICALQGLRATEVAADSIQAASDNIQTAEFIETEYIEQITPDSLKSAQDSIPAVKKHFWRAAAEVVGFNTGLWAFDRYVTNSPWAHISLKSMWDNLKHGFVWDNDKLSTNLFFHPYTGNLYYNAGRSNGFNYWQSGLFAISGSAMWKFILENEYPSANDILATPIGGMCIGEVTYRASDAIIDNRTRGAARFGREVAVFFINPIRSFNRIITGEAWRYDPFSTGRTCGSPALAMTLSAGPSLLHFSHDNAPTQIGGCVKLKLEYGDRYEVKSTKPYDYFTISTTLQAMKGQPVIQQFEIRGRLLARDLMEAPNRHFSIGMYQHFCFFDADTVGSSGSVPYRLGVPASVGAGALLRISQPRLYDLDAYLHLNAVLLGGTVSDHYHLDYRDYNLASGLSVKTGFKAAFREDAFIIALNNNYYKLFTWKGYPPTVDISRANPHSANIMGDKSNASVSITTLRADIRLTGMFYITAQLEHYLRVTRYAYFPTVRSHSLGAQIMFTWRI